MPYFSVIIPVYNRERFVARAVNSCLKQDFDNFEIIVVDDASTDRSVDVVQIYDDPRLKLICHEENRGVCPTKNTGLVAAHGEWIIFLDSDDELPDGALALIYSKGLEIESEISQLRFMCKWDTGKITPFPPLKEEKWDYEGYIRFRERCAKGNGETMSCIRAITFREVRFPEDRSFEGLYHLEFAKRFKTKTYPEIARIYHTDAGNQITADSDTTEQLFAASDHASSMDAIITQHGKALRKWAPTAYMADIRTTAKFHYLAGHRAKATSYMTKYLIQKPYSMGGWILLVFGLLGPKSLAWADNVKKYFRWILSGNRSK